MHDDYLFLLSNEISRITSKVISYIFMKTNFVNFSKS